MNTRSFSHIPCPGIRTGAEGALHIPGKALETLAFEAFSRLSFTFTRKHLERLMDIARDRQGTYSDNDRYTAAFLLKNALTASRGVLPLCQDTGIAAVFGWKGSAVITGGGGEESASLTRGIGRAYRERNLRFSTVRASSFFDEYDPGDNLPAQLSLFSAVPDGFFPYREIGDRAFSGENFGESSVPEEEGRYRFLFSAKGGGSSNKTSFTQGTKALLAPGPCGEFLEKQIS
ncbi:MAG: fumarate hydratase, partial [Spirochaetaceae bacterium]|nr:fumarate hydratase [Spirochaetaceae bacterium]